MARTGKTGNRIVQVRRNAIRVTLGPGVAEKIRPPFKRVRKANKKRVRKGMGYNKGTMKEIIPTKTEDIHTRG